MTYDEIRALNWSSLRHMATSPLEYRWRIDNPQPQTTAMLLGSAIHCRILEPGKFDARYALCEVRRNRRDNAFREWLDEHDGCDPLNPAEWAHVMGAADAVLAHRVAAQMLEGTRREELLQWTDPDTGLECKGRLDAIGPTQVVDIKTDRDPTPRSFNRHAAEMLIHGQMAFYHHGALTERLIDGQTPPAIIAVAKTPPYDVAVYQMVPEDLAAGRTLCLRLMRRLEECAAADLWPGCAPDLQYLDLPPWAAGLKTEMEAW